ncbi:LOG family protein [Nocardioides speluncae]|uniref:LOG family protein n=1 Tax=Nocardioides speluncae TaxID=2670337 RepID=UPI000D686BCD|nr:LOG family protein [Nocardioides speluncae]
MKHTRGRVVEVDSLAAFDLRLARGVRSLDGWHLRGLDLTSRGPILGKVEVAGALFLGCQFGDGDEGAMRDRGAVVFPTIPDAPVDSYRSKLYTARDLYDVTPYDRSFDARAHAWSQRPADPDSALAQALHDHAVDEALGRWVKDRRLVGVMGAHALARGEVGYADAARLGHALGGSLVVATGGGPGAMEAANLGAWLSRQPGGVLDEALGMLAEVPSFRPDIGAWAEAAFAVLDKWPDGGESLGIPTWHYGHEPPNPFASAIAKYFRNATREAILLEICDAGIVFLPGAGGTVQEIFQDACENYYADESSVAPMVLVGEAYWTEQVPAWPLLRALAKGRPMEPHVHLVDTLEEAAGVVSGAGTSASERRHTNRS